MIGRNAFAQGARRCAPLALGALPFGAATGLAAIGQDMTPLEASLMSVLMFAGAAQLATLELLGADAPTLLIVLIGVVINLRFVVYSVALSDWVRPPRLWMRALAAYLISDQAFALTSMRVSENRGHATTEADGKAQPSQTAFFFGAAATLWVAWQLGTALGALIGGAFDRDVGLDLVAPLAFVVLGVGALKDRADVVTAATALITFTLLSFLPYGTALLPAVFVGLVVGNLYARRQARPA